MLLLSSTINQYLPQFSSMFCTYCLLSASELFEKQSERQSFDRAVEKNYFQRGQLTEKHYF